MADLSLNCPKCGGAVNVPIEEDVQEYVCTHCGETNSLHDALGLQKDYQDPLIGAVISEWEIQEKVGEGGFGTVYRAFDKNLQRSVAMKVMLPSLTSNLEFVQKFIREAITAAQLNHPNIVGIHRVGRDEERNLHFLVMEFLSGKTLSDIIDESGEFALDEAISIVSQCSDALAVAHDKNIIHRDIKPENLMMDSAGVVKITDFGLAKTMSTDMKSTKVMGTPHYMSPEQFEGKAVDGRTDIYSLGVTFYYMLTKAKPYEGTNTVQIIYSILTQEPKPVIDLNPEVPEEIWRIIKKMIAKDAADRYENFREVCHDLAAFSEGAQAQKVTCPKCEASNVRGRRFCRECGTSLQIRCPHCGSEEMAGTRHCGECGANVENLLKIRENLGRGEKLRAFGDLKRALGFYQEILQLDPDHQEAHEAKLAIRDDLNSIEEKKAKVDALVEQGNAEDALAAVDGLISSYPKVDDVKTYGQTVRRSLLHRVIDAHLLHAEQSLKKGELETALEAYQKALDVDENRADVAEKLRDLKTRMAAMDQTLATAETALSDGRHEAALRAARDILDLKPDHPRATEIQEAAKHHIDSVGGFVREAAELLDKSEFEPAISRLQMAAEISPGDDAVTKLLAKATRRRNAFEDRVAQARRLLADGELDEASSGVDAALAEIPGHAAALALKREVDDMLASRERHLEIESMVKDGLEAELRGDLVEAKKCLNRALHREPDGDAAVLALERVEGKIRQAARLRTIASGYRDKGEWAAAAAVLDELTDLLPGDRSALEEAEEAKGRQAEIEQALEKASRAIEAKDFDAALAAAETVLALAPQDRSALNVQREAVRGKATVEKHLDEARQLIESELFDDALAELVTAEERGAPANSVERLRAAAEEGKVLLLKSEATRAFEFKDFEGAKERYSQIIELGKDDPDATKGLKLAGKMIRRGERETVLPKFLMVVASLAVLFLLQFKAIQGESGFQMDPVQVAVNRLYTEERGAGADRASWGRIKDGYDEKIKALGESRELTEGREFAEEMSRALAVPESDLLGRRAALTAALSKIGSDAIASKRRESTIKDAVRPIREAIQKDRQGLIARAGDAEKRGDWQEAGDSYEWLLANPVEEGTMDPRLEVGRIFSRAMAAAQVDDALKRLAGLRSAHELVGNNPEMRPIRRAAIQAGITETVRTWIQEIGRDAGSDWTLAARKYNEVMEDPAVKGTPQAADVLRREQFATAMGQAQRHLQGGRYSVALRAYLDAAGTEDAKPVERLAAENGRKSVVAAWKGTVKSLIAEARSQGDITPEKFYRKIITELADMARDLGVDPETLYREVTGD